MIVEIRLINHIIKVNFTYQEAPVFMFTYPGTVNNNNNRKKCSS